MPRNSGKCFELQSHLSSPRSLDLCRSPSSIFPSSASLAPQSALLVPLRAFGSSLPLLPEDCCQPPTLHILSAGGLSVFLPGWGFCPLIYAAQTSANPPPPVLFFTLCWVLPGSAHTARPQRSSFLFPVALGIGVYNPFFRKAPSLPSLLTLAPPPPPPFLFNSTFLLAYIRTRIEQ